jgi:CheY-like chemotaxis protein
LEGPASAEVLADAVACLAAFIERGPKSILVVEDDEVERNCIVELVGRGDDVLVTAVGSSEDAEAELEAKRFDCMVLDLKLPNATGFALLERLKADPRFGSLPVIIYTGKDLTRREETRLKKYAESIIVKTVGSPERLLDETALFLHRAHSDLPDERRRTIDQLHSTDVLFKGRQVLIVDDDVRNVFALTSALESRGIEVLYAENGRDSLSVLAGNPDVDLVLMDIMMPEMDGYETMAALRQMPQFRRLPVIALTAKAMEEDREQSIGAGASDYITKPVDIDQLLSLMQVWLHR